MIYKFSADKQLLDLELITKELQATYWASNRTAREIQKSVEQSLCFGAYIDQEQIGFARVVTDFSTIAYLCDVFVVKKHQGQGVGKLLMNEVLNHPDLIGIAWFLRTRDAHHLYEKFGFSVNEQPRRYMERKAQKA